MYKITLDVDGLHVHLSILMEIPLGQRFQQTLDIADGQNGFVIINIDQKQQMLLGIFLLIWCRQQMILRIIIDHGLGKNLVIRAALEISEMAFHEGCDLIHVKVNVWNVICIN